MLYTISYREAARGLAIMEERKVVAMTTPNPNPSSSGHKHEAPTSTPEAETQAKATDDRSFTQKAREFVGLHTDSDVALLQNDMVRGGITLIATAVNPIVGIGVGAYSVAASVRDRSRAQEKAKNGGSDETV